MYRRRLLGDLLRLSEVDATTAVRGITRMKAGIVVLLSSSSNPTGRVTRSFCPVIKLGYDPKVRCPLAFQAGEMLS